MTATIARFLHAVIDVVGLTSLLGMAMTCAWVLAVQRQDRVARRWRRIDHAPQEIPIRPCTMSRADLQLWLEAWAAEQEHYEAQQDLE